MFFRFLNFSVFLVLAKQQPRSISDRQGILVPSDLLPSLGCLDPGLDPLGPMPLTLLVFPAPKTAAEPLVALDASDRLSFIVRLTGTE